MKLTKSDRESFVRAVVSDLPRTDYQAMMQDLIDKLSFERLPQALRDNWRLCKPFVQCIYLYGPSGWCGSIYAYGEEELRGKEVTTVFPEHTETITNIVLKAKQQASDVQNARYALVNAINACSTLKQAKERFPALVKYLPQDRKPAQTANVPATLTTTLMATLTSAGWKASA